MVDQDEYLRVKEVWDNIETELLTRLYCKNISLYRTSEDECRGINICQVRYINKHKKIRTKWLENKPLKRKEHIISRCQWTFLPLSISPRKRSILSDDQYYQYLMKVRQEEGTSVKSYTAKIVTLKSGARLPERNVVIDEEKGAPLKYKFAFPNRTVSQINKCLANNFFPQLWVGPSCAAWHRTDEGRAFYLGTKRISESPNIRQLLNLTEGANGRAASILMAYSCFSMLKAFYPSYHTLRRNSSYFEVKKHLPKQIVLNVQSDQPIWAKKLIDACCGCFQRLKSDKMPIIDGIEVQRIPSELTRIGVDEYESKTIRPACILWVNREPVKELVQSGKLLNVQVISGVNNELGTFLSECLMNIFANQIHRWTNDAFRKRYDTDWKESVPLIENFLSKLQESAILKFGEYSEESEIVLEELNKFRQNKSEPEDPTMRLGSSKRRIIRKIDNIMKSLADRDSKVTMKLEGLKKEILMEYEKCLRTIRKIHRKNMSEFYSLDSDYHETLERLIANPSVHMMGQEVVKKIAYLQTSFQIFARTAIPSEYQQQLCDKVEVSLVTAFRNQMDIQKPGDILAKYISSLLETGQCARVRGEGSENDNTCIWYDPRNEVFLISSKTYFNKLKNVFSMADISKGDFETELVQANILCTVQRKAQVRRTFEVVVQKGGNKLSVLKINADPLSDQFSESACKRLEQLRNDKTPYRS